ncbi:MAG: hypothetical protein JWM11_3004 [Planctomycetaceae bacterium]|nr:hypothetical protein [Planctomycetaceae bacterium]
MKPQQLNRRSAIVLGGTAAATFASGTVHKSWAADQKFVIQGTVRVGNKTPATCHCFLEIDGQNRLKGVYKDGRFWYPGVPVSEKSALVWIKIPGIQKLRFEGLSCKEPSTLEVRFKDPTEITAEEMARTSTSKLIHDVASLASLVADSKDDEELRKEIETKAWNKVAMSYLSNVRFLIDGDRRNSDVAPMLKCMVDALENQVDRVRAEFVEEILIELVGGGGSENEKPRKVGVRLKVKQGDVTLLDTTLGSDDVWARRVQINKRFPLEVEFDEVTFQTTSVSVALESSSPIVRKWQAATLQVTIRTNRGRSKRFSNSNMMLGDKEVEVKSATNE